MKKIFFISMMMAMATIVAGAKGFFFKKAIKDLNRGIENRYVRNTAIGVAACNYDALNDFYSHDKAHHQSAIDSTLNSKQTHVIPNVLEESQIATAANGNTTTDIMSICLYIIIGLVAIAVLSMLIFIIIDSYSDFTNEMPKHSHRIIELANGGGVLVCG